VLDFTSVLYLGMQHGTRDLPQWSSLTLGKPAALEPPPGAAEVEAELAALTGCGRALLAPSTLHAFCDVFEMLARLGMNALLDAGAYPIAGWGLERAAASGMSVRVFPAHDLQSLRAMARRTRLPVVVADGFCPGCGVAAPLAQYVECVKPRGGLVVIDDTQALGIFGHSPGPGVPYGKGGGGSLRQAGVDDGYILLVSSLAKAFGAPLAVVSGRRDLLERFERESATRVHCSPPSVAAIAAAADALRVNRASGDALRLRLSRRVARLRAGLGKLQLLAGDGLFPVQPLRTPHAIDATELHQGLAARGVQAVLHRARNGDGRRISFVVTARHTPEDIDRALACLADAMARGAPAQVRKGEEYYGTEYRSRIVRPGW
jgi:8-amino-7-oxononanoate synthase